MYMPVIAIPKALLVPMRRRRWGSSRVSAEAEHRNKLHLVYPETFSANMLPSLN